MPMAAGLSAELGKSGGNSTAFLMRHTASSGSTSRPVQERGTYGKFARQFALPIEVEMTDVQAEFKDGVLNVHLPKTAAAAKPKAFEVKVA
jgi:HSP20 family molecular chaperone IbpA